MTIRLSGPAIALIYVLLCGSAAPAAGNIDSGPVLSSSVPEPDDTAGWPASPVSETAGLSSGALDGPFGKVRDAKVQGGYTYVTMDYGLFVLSGLSEVSRLALPGDTAWRLDVQGNYAYVIRWGVGLCIVDISNPDVASLVGTFSNAKNIMAVFVKGNYVFLMEWFGGLIVLDVSNPASPAMAEELAANLQPTGGIAYKADYFSGNQFSCGVRDLLFVGSFGGTKIFDVTNPLQIPPYGGIGSSPDGHFLNLVVPGYLYAVNDALNDFRSLPVMLPNSETCVDIVPAQGEYGSVQIGVSGNGGLALKDNHAYVFPGGFDLHVIDVSSVFNPIEDTVIEDPTAYVNTLTIDGNYLLASANVALQRYDISSPASPSPAGSFYPCTDVDADKVCDAVDNCLSTFNPGQEDFDGDGVGDGCDNCPLTSNPTQADAGLDGVGDACQGSAAVAQSGSNVSVTPVPGATVTFESVATNGVCEIRKENSGTPPPSGYTVSPTVSPVWYQIETSVGYAGSIQICLHYNQAALEAPEDQLQMLHYNPVGGWQNITSSRDLVADVICGTTTSLSPFILVESCCALLSADGKSGNVDGDPGKGVDISDLSALIDYLYISFTPPVCLQSANIDGDSQGGIDISDLSALIDYLYISFTPPAVCR